MTKAKVKIKKAEPKKPPVPLKEWNRVSKFPLSEIGIGDEVESKYHGAGVVKDFIGGNFPVQIDFDGRLFTYSKAGEYFEAESSFADKKPALIITKKMPPMAKEA